MKKLIKISGLTLILVLSNASYTNATGNVTHCYHGDTTQPFHELYAVVTNGICPPYVHPEPVPEPDPEPGVPHFKMHRAGDPDCQLNDVNPFQ